jgi:hypothetical protein
VQKGGGIEIEIEGRRLGAVNVFAVDRFEERVL